MYKLKEDAFRFNCNKINYNNYISMSEHFISITDTETGVEYNIPFNLHFQYTKGMKKNICIFLLKNSSDRISEPSLLEFYENEIKQLNSFCCEVSRLQTNEKHKKIPNLIIDIMSGKSNINDLVFDFHENNNNNKYNFIFKHEFYLKYKKETEKDLKNDRKSLGLFFRI